MNNSNHTSGHSGLSSKTAGAGFLAAIVASLCCITPVFSLLAGIGGIAATFSWMEPFRPYLVIATIGILGFAWYQNLRPRTAEEIECACEEDDKPSFWQTKRFLAIVTIFAALMLAFPSYSHMFYPEIQKGEIIGNGTINLVSFEIEGMTCTGCEEHVNHAMSVLPGVAGTSASWEEGSAEVVFDASELDVDAIVDAVNATGYTVVSKEVRPANAEEIKASLKSVENKDE